MKRPRWSVIGLSAFLLLELPTSTQVPAAPLTGEEIDSLLGSQSTFGRDEVVELLAVVVQMANEEITRTAEEAVKRALLDVAPELARERRVSEEWRSEAKRSQGRVKVFRGVAIAEAAAVAVLAALLSMKEAAR